MSTMSNCEGDYTEPNTIPSVIIANNQMDLVCIDFTKVDPSKDGKEKHPGFN